MKFLYALPLVLTVFAAAATAQVTPAQKADITRSNQERVDALQRQILMDQESFKENRRLNNAAGIEADMARVKVHLKELNAAMKRQERDKKILEAR